MNGWVGEAHPCPSAIDSTPPSRLHMHLIRPPSRRPVWPSTREVSISQTRRLVHLSKPRSSNSRRKQHIPEALLLGTLSATSLKWLLAFYRRPEADALAGLADASASASRVPRFRASSIYDPRNQLSILELHGSIPPPSHRDQRGFRRFHRCRVNRYGEYRSTFCLCISTKYTWSTVRTASKHT